MWVLIGDKMAEKLILPDDKYKIREAVSRWIADKEVDVVISTGGTLGAAAGPWVSGLLFDGQGDYVLAFWLAAGLFSSAHWRTLVKQEERALLTFDQGFGDIRSHPPEEYSGLVVPSPQAARQSPPAFGNAEAHRRPGLTAARGPGLDRRGITHTDPGPERVAGIRKPHNDELEQTKGVG